MKKLDVEDFKKLSEKLINDREKLYMVWEKELVKELQPYFKSVTERECYNYLSEFYFVFTLVTKKTGMMLDFSVEDDNNGSEKDWMVHIHVYDLPKGFEDKYKMVDDCCIFKNKDVYKAIEFLKKLTEEF